MTSCTIIDWFLNTLIMTVLYHHHLLCKFQEDLDKRTKYPAGVTQLSYNWSSSFIKKIDGAIYIPKFSIDKNSFHDIQLWSRTTRVGSYPQQFTKSCGVSWRIEWMPFVWVPVTYALCTDVGFETRDSRLEKRDSRLLATLLVPSLLVPDFDLCSIYKIELIHFWDLLFPVFL